MTQRAAMDLQWQSVPDIAPSDYHLVRSTQDKQIGKHLRPDAELRKWINEWIALGRPTYLAGYIHLLGERWVKVVKSESFNEVTKK